MARGKLLVRNLGLKLDDVRSVAEQRQGLLTSPGGAGEGVRSHDALETHTADLLDDVKQAVPEFDFRRLFDEETGFQISRHERALPTADDSAPRQIADRFMDERLTQITDPALVPLARQTGTRRNVPPSRRVLLPHSRAEN